MPSPPEDLITDDVELAVRALRAGGLVALPTETVYGLAADAERSDAVARIFDTKGRPSDHPLIVHLAMSTWRVNDGWVDDVSEAARALADAHWPGPMTMLLPRGHRVPLAVTGGRDSVGIRVPSHPVAQAVLERFGGALAAPSANRFGRVSPTTARHVLDDLGPHLDPARDLILDGGSSLVGIESTIVDLTVDPPQVLRAGAVTERDVERVLSASVAPPAGPSRASGMLQSHYAPVCDVVLADDAATARRLHAALSADGRRARVLDRTDDLIVFARSLYADLRDADRDGLDALVVVMPSAEGIGHAIRDRLIKAAADRPDRPSRAG